MAARFILNADDFGLTRGINRAVSELHAAGALTSATLIATGPAFDDAVAIARSRPTLGVGCHIVLTDGTPLSHPNSIPSLLGSDGKRFRPSLAEFVLAVLRGKVLADDIIREAVAQVQHLQRAGIDVTHLDTHKHTHILPQVAAPLLYVAERCGIGAVRNPFEPSWATSLAPADPLRRLQLALVNRLQPKFAALPQLQTRSILTTGGTLGISATGRLDGPTLRALLAAAPAAEPDTLWELVLHPGYNDHDLDQVTTRLRASRDIERRALLAVFNAPSQPPAKLPLPRLIHYGELGTTGILRSLGQHVPNTGHEPIL